MTGTTDMSTTSQQSSGEPPVAATLAGPPTMRSRLLGAVRVGLLLVVVAAAVWAIASRREEVLATLQEMSWRNALPSFLAILAGLVCGTMSWQVLLDDLGEPVGVRRGAQVCLVGQLGKYVPGSVWAYVLQVELGRRYGIARARVFAASLFSVAVAVVASLVAGSLALPVVREVEPRLLWLYVLLPLGLAALHPRVLTTAARLAFRLLRRPRPDHVLGYGAILRSLAWAVGSYVCYGTHLWLLTGAGVSAWGVSIGAMAVAMIAGLFAFVLPSGVGVREAVVVAAIAPLVGAGAALAFAVASRLMFIVADLLVAGGAALLARTARPAR